MIIIIILIIFFIFLLSYQFLDAFLRNNLLEGLTNETNSTPVYIPFKTTPESNSIANAEIKQYAGNIEYLKMKVDNLESLKGRVDTMQTNIDSLQKQVDGLVQQQATFAQELVGTNPPTITGTEPETAANVATGISNSTTK